MPDASGHSDRRGPMRLNGRYVAEISRACVVNTRLTIKIKLNLRPRAFSELSASVAPLGRNARVLRPRHIATEVERG
jgi:hypothetical protein